MADSKWLDPVSNDSTWVFADWTDEELSVLLDLVWNTLRDAAAERLAFGMKVHSGDFPAADTFPDLSDDLNLATLIEETPNNIKRIENAIYYIDNDIRVLETDDIQDSGVVVADSPPAAPSLAQLLEDILLYASDLLLHRNDLYQDPVNELVMIPALSQYAWVKQWFEVMNYQTWYWRTLKQPAPATLIGDVYTALEFQDTSINVLYQYITSTSTFNAASCTLDDGVNPPVDIYIANDLKETAPFSTPQQVRDYAIAQLAANDSTWTSSLALDLGDKEWSTKLFERNDKLTGSIFIRCTLNLKRVRFKLTDDFRPVSPNKFNAPVYGNTYYTGASVFVNNNVTAPADPVIATYNDFGTGKTNNDVENIALTKDGNDYYNLEIENPDWDTQPVLPLPTAISAFSGFFSQDFLLQRMAFAADATLGSPFKLTNTTPITQTNTGILFKPNLTDGTAFEHYTPA